MTTPDDRYVDGNAAAGSLGEIFTMDITTAVGRCDSCGSAGVLAEARAYMDAPGLVMRCATCDDVLLRVVRSADRAWIDLRGLTSLQLMMTAPA